MENQNITAQMINVTKNFFLPQEEYQAILERAWDNGWMTNRGALVQVTFY